MQNRSRAAATSGNAGVTAPVFEEWPLEGESSDSVAGSLQEALRRLTRIEGIVAGPPVEEAQFDSFTEDYLERVRKSQSIFSFRSKRSCLRRASEFFGSRTLTEIRPAEVLGFRDFLHASGYSANSIRNALAVLSTAFADAVARGYARSNPVTRVPKPRAHKRPLPLLSDETQSHLLECCKVADARLWAIVLVLLRTGLRIGEMCELTWSRGVDRERQELVVLRSKTKQPRRVPYPQEVSDALDSLIGCRRTTKAEPDGVFPWSTRSGAFDLLWRDARELAGLEWLRVHDLRHQCACDWLAAGVRPQKIRRWLGHANLAMTMHYLDHVEG